MSKNVNLLKESMTKSGSSFVQSPIDSRLSVSHTASTYANNASIFYELETLNIRGIPREVKRLYIRSQHSDFEGVGWILNEDILECMVCSNPFGMFRYRHHCRSCGSLVCDNCSPNRTIIFELKEFGEQRVCVLCFWGQDPVHAMHTRSITRDSFYEAGDEGGDSDDEKSGKISSNSTKRTLLKEFSSEELAQLRKQLEIALEEKKLINSELSAARSEIFEMEKSHQSSLSNLHSQIEEERQSAFDTQQEKESEVLTLKRELSRLSLLRQSDQGELDTIRQQQESLENQMFLQIQQIETDRDQAVQKAETLSGALKALQKTLDSETEKGKHRSEEAEEMTGRVRDLEARIESQDRALKDSQREIKTLLEENKVLEAQLAETRQQLRNQSEGQAQTQQSLESEVFSLRENVTNQETQLRSLQSQLVLADKDKSELQKRLESLSLSLESSQASLSTLQDTFADEKRVLQERIKDAERKMSVFESTIDELSLSLKEKSSSLESVSSEREALLVQVSSLAADLKSTSQAYQDEKQRLQDEISALQSTSISLAEGSSSSEGEMNEKLQAAKNEMLSAFRAKDEACKRSEELQHTLSSLQASIESERRVFQDKFSSNEQSFLTQLEASRRKNDDLSASLSSLEALASSSQSEISSLQKSLASLTSEKSSLDEELARKTLSHSSEIQTLKEQSESLQQGLHQQLAQAKEEYLSLKQEMTEKAKSLREMTTTLEELRTNLQALEREKLRQLEVESSLRIEVQDALSQVSSQKDLMYDLTQKTEQLESERSALQIQFESSTERLASQDQQIQSMVEKQQELTLNIHSFGKEKDSLTQQLKSLSQSLEESQFLSSVLQTRLDQETLANEESTQEKNIKLSESEASISQGLTQIKQLEQTIQSLTEEKASLSTELAALQTRFDSLSQTGSESSSQIQELQTAVQSLQGQLLSSESQWKEKLHSSENNLEQERERFESQFQSLSETIKQHEEGQKNNELINKELEEEVTLMNKKIQEKEKELSSIRSQLSESQSLLNDQQNRLERLEEEALTLQSHSSIPSSPSTHHSDPSPVLLPTVMMISTQSTESSSTSSLDLSQSDSQIPFSDPPSTTSTPLPEPDPVLVPAPVQTDSIETEISHPSDLTATLTEPPSSQPPSPRDLAFSSTPNPLTDLEPLFVIKTYILNSATSSPSSVSTPSEGDDEEAGGKEKLFLNLCCHPQVPLVEDSDSSFWFVVSSLGETVDKEGGVSHLCDLVLNSEFFDQHIKGQKERLETLGLFALDAVRRLASLSLDPQFKTPKVKGNYKKQSGGGGGVGGGGSLTLSFSLESFLLYQFETDNDLPSSSSSSSPSQSNPSVHPIVPSLSTTPSSPSPTPSPLSQEILSNNQKYSEYLSGLGSGMNVLAAGLISKKNPMGFAQSRLLILTDKPLFFYSDPKTKEMKGEIEWTSTSLPRIDVVSSDVFDIITSNRTYRFTDKERGPHYWQEKLASATKLYKSTAKVWKPSTRGSMVSQDD